MTLYPCGESQKLIHRNALGVVSQLITLLKKCVTVGILSGIAIGYILSR